MKPRTQYQQMVCKSDKGITPIGKRVIKWATDTLTEHYAYRYPDSLRHTCMECGHQWNVCRYYVNGQGRYEVIGLFGFVHR